MILYKLRNGISTRITNIVKSALEDLSKEVKTNTQVTKDLKERLDNIPYMRCWLDGAGISPGKGRIEYMGKSFCGEPHFQEYLRLVEKPNSAYRYINGEIVKEY